MTDKAVSKWERDLSCPDVNLLPKLAEVFGVTVDELMLGRTEEQADGKSELKKLIPMIMKAVALAMGVGVAALSALGKLDVSSGLGMLGIGLACLASDALSNGGEQ